MVKSNEEGWGEWGKFLLPPFLPLLREQKSLLTVWMGQEKCYPSQDLKNKVQMFCFESTSESCTSKFPSYDTNF